MTRLMTLAFLILLLGGTAASQTPSGPDIPNLAKDPIPFSSVSEQFQVIFPSGCGKIHTRNNEPDLYAGEDYDDIVLVEFASCDRYQEKGEGCSVGATFNFHDKDGNMAGPEQVVLRVEETLAQFGATVVDQKPVRRDFGEDRVVEGVRVAAVGPEGKGEVLIMGLLIYGDIYILSAWNVDGGLMEDSEVQTFFDSFRPFVE